MAQAAPFALAATRALAAAWQPRTQRWQQAGTMPSMAGKPLRMCQQAQMTKFSGSARIMDLGLQPSSLAPAQPCLLAALDALLRRDQTAKVCSRCFRQQVDICAQACSWLWCAESTLAEECPDLAAQWHPTKNEDLTPADVTCGSDRRVWWLCTIGQCGHDHAWEARIDSRDHSKRGCPICAGKTPCNEPWCNSLKALHPLTVELQWDYERNMRLKPPVRPESLLPRSNKLVFWRCDLHSPPHRWTAAPDKRFRKHRPTECPKCARLRQCKPKVGKLPLQEAPAACWQQVGCSLQCRRAG